MGQLQDPDLRAGDPDPARGRVQGRAGDGAAQGGRVGEGHPDDGSAESWTEEGSGDKMRAEFADFEPSYVTIRGIESIGVTNGKTPL